MLVVVPVVDVLLAVDTPDPDEPFSLDHILVQTASSEAYFQSANQTLRYQRRLCHNGSTSKPSSAR